MNHLTGERPVTNQHDSVIFVMETMSSEEIVESLENNLMKMGNPAEGIDLPMEISDNVLHEVCGKTVLVGEKSGNIFEMLSGNKIRLRGPPVPVSMMGFRGYVYMEEEGYNGFLPITCIENANEDSDWCIKVRFVIFLN